MCPPGPSPEGLLAGGFPGIPERRIVYGALEYRLSLPGLLGQGANSWWMEGGRMAKGLCPGVGQSLKKQCRENRKRERERPKFLRVCGKPIKPFYRACTAHEAQGILSRKS